MELGDRVSNRTRYGLEQHPPPPIHKAVIVYFFMLPLSFPDSLSLKLGHMLHEITFLLVYL